MISLRTSCCSFALIQAAWGGLLPALASPCAALEILPVGQRRIMVIEQREQEVVVNGVQQLRIVSAARDLQEITPQVWWTWVFRTHDPDAIRKQLDEALAQRLDGIENLVALSGAQRNKLLLAGQGDVSRFLADCESAYLCVPANDRSQRSLAVIQQECQALRVRLATGLHESESLFGKSLLTVLDADQLRAIETHELARRNAAVLKVRQAAGPRFMILDGNRLIQLEVKGQ